MAATYNKNAVSRPNQNAWQGEAIRSICLYFEFSRQCEASSQLPTTSLLNCRTDHITQELRIQVDEVIRNGIEGMVCKPVSFYGEFYHDRHLFSRLSKIKVVQFIRFWLLIDLTHDDVLSDPRMPIGIHSLNDVSIRYPT